jgi:hypothetical protein
LQLKEIKWSGISVRGSVDSERLRRERFLLSGNPDGAEDFAGILRTAQRRRMGLRSLDKIRAPINGQVITY